VSNAPAVRQIAAAADDDDDDYDYEVDTIKMTRFHGRKFF